MTPGTRVNHYREYPECSYCHKPCEIKFEEYFSPSVGSGDEPVSACCAEPVLNSRTGNELTAAEAEDMLYEIKEP